jgi:hypothetical protein
LILASYKPDGGSGLSWKFSEGISCWREKISTEPRNGFAPVDQLVCQLLDAFLEMEKMSSTIMFQSWEVKPFFITGKAAGERTKVLQCFAFPYTGESVSLDRKFALPPGC